MLFLLVLKNTILILYKNKLTMMLKYMIIVLLTIIGISVIVDFSYTNNMATSTMTITDKSDSSGFFKIKSMGGDWYVTKQSVYNKVVKGNTYVFKIDTMKFPNRMVVEIL